MKKLFNALLIVSGAVASTGASAASGQTTLPQMWKSHRYAPHPLPPEWQMDATTKRPRELQPFLDWPAHTVQVRDVIAHFGVPDRYLVATHPEQDNFLIYDLPSGYTVAFYVAQPSINIFKAGVVLDAKGKLVRLIK